MLFEAPESSGTLVVHGINLGLNVTILIFVLKYNKVWVRLKDRVDELWFNKCKGDGTRFTSLDHGNDKE